MLPMAKIQHSLLLLVAFGVLHLVPAASSSSSSSSCSSSSPSPLTKNLIDWIRSREGGIYNPKQEEKTFCENNSNSRGIFATEDIAAGEILLQVPWDSIIGAKGATKDVIIAEDETKAAAEAPATYYVTQCRMVRDLYNEVQKGEASDFAPHLRYLSLLDNDDGNHANEHFLPVIPALWSEEGRDLLEDINDHGVLPPVNGLFTTLNHDKLGACIEDIKNNPLEAKVAAVVAAHESSGTAYLKFGILVPLFDNYHYNQRLQKQTEDENEELSADDHDTANANLNAKGIIDYDESFRLVATRPIQKGEEIYRPFGNFLHNEFTTPDIFRSYGIADATIYPKFYEFAFPVPAEEELFVVEIELDEDFDNGSRGGNGFHVDIQIYDEDDAQQPEKVIQFFERELNRLQRLKAVVSRPSGFPEHGTMTQKEWDTAWLYHRNLVMVMQLALKELRSDDSDEETNYDCPGGFTTTQKGTCPIWDGFDYLPSSMPTYDLTLQFNEDNPYGPTEES